eukprot:Skav225637  [mRNA]  locus=scaffold1716:71324:82402:+ [translate_table: standard]
MAVTGFHGFPVLGRLGAAGPHLVQLNAMAQDLAQEMPSKVAKMKEIFTVEATKNKALGFRCCLLRARTSMDHTLRTCEVLPVGAGLYTIYYHPEEGPRSPLTEWTLYEGMTRIAESNAPGYHSGQMLDPQPLAVGWSSLSTIDVDVPSNASGVLFAVGGTSAGVSVYFDGGYLYAEYMATLLYRYIAKSQAPVAAGKHKIQVRLIYSSEKSNLGSTTWLAPPADLTLFVDGANVEKSIRLVFDASETFDVGMDLGSPVSLRYADRCPFKFNGKLHSLNVKYINGTQQQQVVV